MRAVVVGAGAWGTAFARVLASRGHDVTLAARDPEQARAIEETGRNPRYLPDLDLEGIAATTVDDPSLAGADLHVVAVPSNAFAEVVRALPGAAPVLSLTKGLDPESGGRLSERVERRAVAVLSGPNLAEEIAEGLPAAAVIASKDAKLAEELQQAVNSMAFRVYVNDDLVGVELCAAAKNVIALAAGGVDGLSLGDNAKAALIARGLAEMARLGEACGGRTETFSGLAGMGDLMVTCWSRQGRNRRAGELIAQGASPEEAAAQIGTVEGLTTAPVLRALSHRVGIELPITEGVCHVLDGQDLNEFVCRLMGRQPTGSRPLRRLLPFLALAALLAGCGSASKTSSRGGSIPRAQASSGPASSRSSQSTATRSSQWKQLDELRRSSRAATGLLRLLEQATDEGGSTTTTDVKPALGPELDIAVVSAGNESSTKAVALTKPDDPAKFKALVAKLKRRIRPETTVYREVDGWYGSPTARPRSAGRSRATRARRGRRLQGSDGQASGRRAREVYLDGQRAERDCAAVVGLLGRRCARARQAEVHRRLGERGGRRSCAAHGRTESSRPAVAVTSPRR